MHQTPEQRSAPPAKPHRSGVSSLLSPHPVGPLDAGPWDRQGACSGGTSGHVLPAPSAGAAPPGQPGGTSGQRSRRLILVGKETAFLSSDKSIASHVSARYLTDTLSFSPGVGL